MKKIKSLLFTLFISICICAQTENLQRRVTDIAVPQGYELDTFPKGSFSHFVQNLKLKNTNTILKYNGKKVHPKSYNVLGVLNLSILFSEDLEQCADFAMRIWAEYYRYNNNLSNLFLYYYNGKKRRYNPQEQNLNKFLRKVFVSANSYSLKVGCKAVKESDLKPGDLIVQNIDGGIGHVSVVMNSCHKSGKSKLFLIGYSYMPAQEFHIEDAMDYGELGWFTIEGSYLFLKENLNMGAPVLRRFE